MTERPSPTEGPVPSASFDSSPSDTGRAYQAAGNQHFHEHHYHGPVTHPTPAAAARPARGRFALLGGASAAVLLAAVAGGGTWLWMSHQSSGVTAGGKAPHSAGPSAAGSSSASPSAKRRSAAPETGAATGHSAPPADAIPDAQSSAPVPTAPPNPADPRNCRAWFTLREMPDVKVRPCWRRDGSRVYMIGEWQATQGAETVDVYLWLKDASGKAVYPGTQPLAYLGMGAYPADSAAQQWRQEEVGINLVRRAKYTVCLSVYHAGSAKPNITNSAVSGVQKDFTY
ncbi:hypothetical protein GCM10010260_05240 [Streptomyces filipinensis]|uniref:Uncharacterized protein n=1 Tax=Streptomyces filipinensis TaxID=66887 RepID=A0A918I7D8_9ACTN|nr:hypothetical protein [Streptomyces filipinensis]GGU76026.1 hypothetical protein GCM10010260_05240 [Streptomyces filipinensis]